MAPTRSAAAWRAAALLAAAFASPAGAAEIVLRPTEVIETKAVYGRVESRDTAPARARIGGTVTQLTVTEGDAVTAGQSLGRVTDDKLALQLRAADARLRALTSEQVNTRSEAERAQTLLERGSSTQQRADQLRTQLEVIRSQIAAAEAERAVIVQQSAEGEIVAPVAGRALKVSVTRNAVVMPGEAIAQIAGGGYFLRLALPERHAGQLQVGAAVAIGADEGKTAGNGRGRIARIFPQIENGRVVADVEVAAAGDFFVGLRVLAHVPIGRRMALVVPESAIRTLSGVDFVTLATTSGTVEVAVVRGGPATLAQGAGAGPGVEILSGLRVGDRVVTR